MDILTLHRKGFKQRAIARTLGISRNTVKKDIEDPELVLSPGKPRQRKSLLDRFNDNMEAWLNEDRDDQFFKLKIMALHNTKSALVG